MICAMLWYISFASSLLSLYWLMSVARDGCIQCKGTAVPQDMVSWAGRQLGRALIQSSARTLHGGEEQIDVHSHFVRTPSRQVRYRARRLPCNLRHLRQ
jgi:hypothetical protein